jgi:murein DD-endopeptidase MepM/ murein hydrolase activator NlpD
MWTDGASPGATPGRDTTASGVNLHSGHIMNVHITYDGTTLAWIITDTTTRASFQIGFPVDIVSLVGANQAYVGFTGGTGSLTATQDIINWTYNAVPVAAFAWPVNTPVTYAASACGGPNNYSTYCSETPIFGQYHTGIDVCPQSPGCGVGNAVFASSTGVVEVAMVVSESTETLCDGSSDSGYQKNSNSSNLGNVIVIAHPNGKFTLYGHLDCIWPGIKPGIAVDAGQRIGDMGHSGFGQRTQTFTPHTHFEMKDRGVLGDPTNLGYSGYTTDVPEGYGYHDARIYLNPFSTATISPTAVKVVASTAQSVRTGPDSSFAHISSVAPSQEFVATGKNGAWYKIDLPNVNGPVSGWVQGSSGSGTLLTVDSSAAQIQVTGASGSGLDMTLGANATPHLVSWDQTFSNCAHIAKIWNGQRYVRIATQNGFDEFYMPLNYYFSSGNSCGEPAAAGPSTGWASSSFLQ